MGEEKCTDNKGWNEFYVKYSMRIYIVLEIFTQYDWKGNIQELKNVLEYATATVASSVITKNNFPSHILPDFSFFSSLHLNQNLQSLKDVEMQDILKVMEKVNGNKVKAVNILEINRLTLHNKLKQYEGKK